MSAPSNSRLVFLLGLASAVALFALFQAGTATRDLQQTRADLDELAGILGAMQEQQVAVAVAERSRRQAETRSGAENSRRLAAVEYGVRALQGGESAVEHRKVITSPPHRIDQIYKSMLGPFNNAVAPILDQPNPELLWLTGYRTQVVDAEAGQRISQEYMCHVNLDLVEVDKHNERFDKSSPMLQDRIFTLTQGQQEVRLPPGFGVPLMSDEKLYFATQVLNLNKPDISIDVRQQTELTFLRDSELTRPITPMYLRAIQVFKVMEGEGEEGAHYGFELGEDSEARGGGCAIGQSAMGAEAWEVADAASGTRFTPHWVVEPGPETSETNVTRYLNLESDTRVHFIGAHMHPYGESLEFVDLTDGRVIFEAVVKNTTTRVGLQHIGSMTSEEGIPLYKDHQYGLISKYNNPTDEPTDAMASMFLYMEDSRFQRPMGM
jgi:hypothetical protein